MVWNPEQYLKFADHRLRPAVDLLNRVGAAAPDLVCDLGSGAGNVTSLLAARWPQARVVGVDSSPQMLAKAAAALPQIEWVRADIATWRPDRPADVIFSNAALHWLGDHRRLFETLLAALAPGGVLAVQMPANHDRPSHTGIAETVRGGPWRSTVEPLLREHPVHPVEFYWDVLSAAGARMDAWYTDYVQVLTGDNPIVEWTSGSALKPLLDALDEPWRGQFLADYGRRMAAAYPPRPDGTTLFPFRRLFIVATPR
jgi:trans-aconitate 2-methyltransferase